jgi:hypothetical protein
MITLLIGITFGLALFLPIAAVAGIIGMWLTTGEMLREIHRQECK